MESFEETMERLFNSLASGKSYRSINRLDLFKILFDDQQAKIDTLLKAIEKYEACRGFYSEGYTFDEDSAIDDKDCEQQLNKPWLYVSGKLARNTAKDENVIAAKRMLKERIK